MEKGIEGSENQKEKKRRRRENIGIGRSPKLLASGYLTPDKHAAMFSYIEGICPSMS